MQSSFSASLMNCQTMTLEPYLKTRHMYSVKQCPQPEWRPDGAKQTVKTIELFELTTVKNGNYCKPCIS